MLGVLVPRAPRYQQPEYGPMSKLKNLFAVALLTLPILSLSAADLGARVDVTQVRPASVAGCCYVYYMGHWYCFPC
jgi:hypothetical protein